MPIAGSRCRRDRGSGRTALADLAVTIHVRGGRPHRDRVAIPHTASGATEGTLVQPPSILRPRAGHLAYLSVAVALTLTMALPTNASFSRTQVMRASQDQLTVAAFASDRNAVVVAWQEPDMTLDLRISLDGGATFGPRLPLGRALSAGMAICGGLIVVERWDGSAIKLDLRSLDGRLRSERALAKAAEFTYGANVACVGTRRAIIEWIAWRNDDWQLRTELVPLLEPLPSVVYRLGTVPQYRIFSVAGTDQAAWVAWQHGDDVLVRRFDVADDDQATVTPRPAHVVATVPGGMASPRIGATGDHVYLSYADQGVTVIRDSVDAGDTFGEARTVFDPAGGPESGPADLHASGDEVLLGVHQGVWGDVGSNWGMLSTDGGATWTTGRSSTGGYQIDTLVNHDGQTQVAELWDDRALDVPRHRIRFHVGSI
jgi:hypothetical protein